MYLAWKEKCCSACLFPNETSEQCAGKHKGTYVLWFAYWRRSSATCLNGRTRPPSRPAGTGKRSKWGSSCSFVNRCLNSLCLAGSVEVALRVQPTTSRLRNMQNQPRVGSVEGCHQEFKHLWQSIFLIIRGSLRCQLSNFEWLVIKLRNCYQHNLKLSKPISLSMAAEARNLWIIKESIRSMKELISKMHKKKNNFSFSDFSLEPEVFFVHVH